VSPRERAGPGRSPCTELVGPVRADLPGCGRRPPAVQPPQVLERPASRQHTQASWQQDREQALGGRSGPRTQSRPDAPRCPAADDHAQRVGRVPRPSGTTKPPRNGVYVAVPYRDGLERVPGRIPQAPDHKCPETSRHGIGRCPSPPRPRRRPGPARCELDPPSALADHRAGAYAISRGSRGLAGGVSPGAGPVRSGGRVQAAALRPPSTGRAVPPDDVGSTSWSLQHWRTPGSGTAGSGSASALDAECGAPQRSMTRSRPRAAQQRKPPVVEIPHRVRKQRVHVGVLVLEGVPQLVCQDDLVGGRQAAVGAHGVQPFLAGPLVVEPGDVLLEQPGPQRPQVGIERQQIEGQQRPRRPPGPAGTRSHLLQAGRQSFTSR
jgi:hypothetical protein